MLILGTNCDRRSFDLASNRFSLLQSEKHGWPAYGKELDVAKLVFGMNQSLDGYVDLTAIALSPALFRHFIEEAQGQAGSVYGRKMYEITGESIIR